MSLKGALQPPLAAWLTSLARQDRRRRRAEAWRKLTKQPYELTWWHRADSPHSFVLAQALPGLLDHFPDLQLVPRLIAEPVAAAMSDRERWQRWAMADAAELAGAHGLVPPAQQPRQDAVRRAHGRLQQLSGRPFLEAAIDAGHLLFGGRDVAGPSPELAQLQAGLSELHSAGHDYPGVLSFLGENFWSLGRLGLLEQWLVGLGLGRRSCLTEAPAEPLLGARKLQLWLSARSPYSYLALDRVERICREHELELELKPVLPMVMRGVPAPLRKRMFILFDAAREAHAHHIPFGRICDPLGGGVERVLAVYPLAHDEGRGLRWLQAALRGIWSEGVDVSTDAGLVRVADEAGLPEALMWRGLDEDRWESLVEDNRQDLERLGLWGVPSVRLSGPEDQTLWTAWGQDRLWILERRLEAAKETP